MAAPVQDVYMYLIKKIIHLAEGENCKTHLNNEQSFTDIF